MNYGSPAQRSTDRLLPSVRPLISQDFDLIPHNEFENGCAIFDVFEKGERVAKLQIDLKWELRLNDGLQLDRSDVTLIGCGWQRLN
jgi:hypothetical protein